MNLRNAFLFLAFGCSTVSFANETAPRGPDIRSEAGACGVGPFGSVGDTGEYGAVCGQLTPFEVCFAYVRGHLQANGQVQNAYDRAKAAYCTNLLFDKMTREN